MGLDLFHFVPALQAETTDYLEFIELAELADAPGYIELNKHFIVEEDFEELGMLKLIRLEIIGQQRKGVSRQFYTDFVNDKPYLDLASVTRAYHYLQQDHLGTLAELQQNFQRHFIDPFVAGKSIFCASW
ncbi:MAG: hypothetical protein ACRYFX_08985 [Janthinobacterium lividum]